MNTNPRLYALVVTSNRFGRDVVCELAEPPSDWWGASEYMQMRVMSQETGYMFVNELIHYEMAAEEWFGYTGLPLVWCIREVRRS
jgi:hypothetical protein